MYTQINLFGDLSTGKCNRCGRTLTNPVSIARGIGPICSGKGYRKDHRPMSQDSDDITDQADSTPLTDGIIISRNDQGVITNVPHFAIEHSPTGFEFGYGGSGPADLALNIVEAILHNIGFDGPTVKCYRGKCFSTAYLLHQDFKWQFIASLPREGGIYDYQQTEQWVKQKLTAMTAKLH